MKSPFVVAVIVGFFYAAPAVAQEMGGELPRLYLTGGVQQGDRITIHTDGDGHPQLAEDASGEASVDGNRWWVRAADGSTTAELELTPDGRVIAPPNSTLSVPPAPRRQNMIGVSLSEVNEALAAQLVVDANDTAMIAAVTEGHAAANAGLRPFDVIVAVNGDRHASVDAIKQAILAASPGSDLALTIIREGRQRSVDVPVEQHVVDEARGQYSLFSRYYAAPSAQYQQPAEGFLTLPLISQLFNARVQAQSQGSEGESPAGSAEAAAAPDDVNARLSRLEALLKELLEQNRGR